MREVDTTKGTWPTIELLVSSTPHPLGDMIPDLSKRYKELGGKYALEEIHKPSGLPINSCMKRDNLQECYEEMVDAIFNILVYNYRYPERNGSHLLASMLSAVRMLREEGIEYGTNLQG